MYTFKTQYYNYEEKQTSKTLNSVIIGTIHLYKVMILVYIWYKRKSISLIHNYVVFPFGVGCGEVAIMCSFMKILCKLGKLYLNILRFFST